MARYSVRPTDERAAGMLADACGLGLTAAQVLLHRGVRSPEEAGPFLDATLRGMSSPSPMADRSAASKRIARAVRRFLGIAEPPLRVETAAEFLAEVVR